MDPDNPNCEESSAYPADPDSEYGWEKLFSERLYLSFARNKGMQVRIGRYHNIFGPEGSWNDGREKAPAALCRKVAVAEPEGTIEVWGDGKQTRSFLYVDECLDGTTRLMRSSVQEPVNIGSEEMVTIDQLALMIMGIAGKSQTIRHIPGPLGVRGRRSDNRLIKARLGWHPSRPLREGVARTYPWIARQVSRGATDVSGSEFVPATAEDATVAEAEPHSRSRDAVAEMPGTALGLRAVSLRAPEIGREPGAQSGT